VDMLPGPGRINAQQQALALWHWPLSCPGQPWPTSKGDMASLAGD
jgi:hypothetical protein